MAEDEQALEVGRSPCVLRGECNGDSSRSGSRGYFDGIIIEALAQPIL